MKKTSLFIFGKRNYTLMILGVLIIAAGFILMLGHGANTTPEGKFDPHYFNENIFSFRRIRLAPLVILIGFVIEIFAIMLPASKIKNES